MRHAERAAVVDERLPGTVGRVTRRDCRSCLRRAVAPRLVVAGEGVCAVDVHFARTSLVQSARSGDDAAEMQWAGRGAGGQRCGAVDRKRRRRRSDGEVVGDADCCGRGRGYASGTERDCRTGDRERAGAADRDAAHFDRRADGDRRRRGRRERSRVARAVRVACRRRPVRGRRPFAGGPAVPRIVSAMRSRCNYGKERDS